MRFSPTYLSTLQTLLASPAVARGEASPSSPLATFLTESQQAGTQLVQAWQAASDPSARHQIEVQLLASAAADLAVLAQSGGQDEPVTRGAEALWPLIQTGLTQPQTLLQPSIRPRHYRGADKDLLAAVYGVLMSIREDATETVSDAITGALTMNFAILREAARLAGTDIKTLLKDLGADEIAALAGQALYKLLALVGEANLAHIQQAAQEALEKLQEKAAVATYMERFLATQSIYQESRALVQAYEGPDRDLARLTPRILAIEGSFSGRNKLAAAWIRLLALAKLIPALKTPPWGPLATASGYILIIGYELYTAHDHVDSDRYPFFDRVAGVHTLMTEALFRK